MKLVQFAFVGCFIYFFRHWSLTVFCGTFMNWQCHRSFGMPQNNNDKKKIRTTINWRNLSVITYKSIVFFGWMLCCYAAIIGACMCEWVCLIIGRNSFLLHSLLFWRVCHNLVVAVVVSRIAMLIKRNQVAKP